MLALLAFAALPAFAQAEDSSGANYQVGGPGEYETGLHSKEKEKSKPKSSEAKAHASTETPATGESSGEEPEVEESSEEEAQAHPGTGGNGNSKPPSGGKHPGNNATEGSGKTGLGEKEAVVTSSKPGTPVESSSGGSSPLVPILIAIAVLAAISIGAVLYRQRRSDSGDSGGASVSPKAS